MLLVDHQKLKTDALANKQLIMASIELTEFCNLRCLHCYIPKKKSILSKDKAKAILDKLYQLGILYITFTGGEVFLHPHFCDIYIYAKSKGFLISLMTNGTLIDNKIKKVLKKYKPFDISVSIYGLNATDYIHFTGKDHYKNLIDGLDYFENESISFNLKTVLVKSNYPSALANKYEELAKKYNKSMMYDPIIFGKKNGDTSNIIERLSANEVVEFEKSQVDSVNFWRQAVSNIGAEASINCGGGLSSLSIDSLGKVSICSIFITEKINFLDKTKEDIIQFLENTHQKMQYRYKQSPCFKCNKKNICKWCSAYAKLEHGSNIETIQFLCELADNRIKAFG